MKDKLISSMQQSMQIFPYQGEGKKEYHSRLVYSGLSQWLRYSILDDCPSDEPSKSKSYVLARGREQLVNFLVAFPECRNWFMTSEADNSGETDPVRDMRNKMLAAGEFLELETGSLMLPSYSEYYVCPSITRKLGIDLNRVSKEFFVGVSRISVENGEPDTVFPTKLWDLDRIMKSEAWVECNDLSIYEFFDPSSRQAPYKSWGNHYKKNELLLGRTTLYNELHEYYLFRYRDNKWMNWAFPTILMEAKEERRFISLLRRKAGNPICAEMQHKNSAVILKLNARLPLAEESIIETFCWPLNSFNDKLSYVVPMKIWDYIKTMLSNDMGILIKEID